VEERISRGRFLRLGTALGVGAASASMLAACGGGGSESGGESGGGSGSGGESESGGGSGGNAGGSTKSGGSKETQASGGQAIAKASAVAPGSAVEFKDSGQPAVLVHLDSGDFVAYSAVCTHQACTVTYRGGQLACPCHGSIFDPANGAAVVSGPARRPLPEVPVEVSGGEVLRA
jgi:cytochrome b6-f complex iron-sulfur subunit